MIVDDDVIDTVGIVCDGDGDVKLRRGPRAMRGNRFDSFRQGQGLPSPSPSPSTSTKTPTPTLTSTSNDHVNGMRGR
ncbi:MAG: hypothetical protein K8W52_06425 [Deltaproteobacteria bacterium]|nr:hypothetical protein [Deltaproteobacteria bacterium]